MYTLHELAANFQGVSFTMEAHYRFVIAQNSGSIVNHLCPYAETGGAHRVPRRRGGTAAMTEGGRHMLAITDTSQLR